MESDDAPLLWSRPTTTRRGPKPKFTLDAIVDAAIDIADESGLDAATMQQIAERLGTTKMALYRYVSSRGDLEAAMLDRALGEPDGSDSDHWRDGLMRWAHGIHARTASRPWAVELAQRPHIPGPAELSWFERGLAPLHDLPLRGTERLDVLALLIGHVLSLSRRQSQDAASEADLSRGLAPILAARADEFPHTVAAFADAADDPAQDEALRFGLDRILDGIQALIAGREAAEPR